MGSARGAGGGRAPEGHGRAGLAPTGRDAARLLRDVQHPGGGRQARRPWLRLPVRRVPLFRRVAVSPVRRAVASKPDLDAAQASRGGAAGTRRAREDGRKMSKSLGNLVTVEETLQRAPAAAVRLYLVSHRYRRDWSFSWDGLTRAARLVDRLADLVGGGGGGAGPQGGESRGADG